MIQQDGTEKISMGIYDLKTEYLHNPIGIDICNPTFSWKLKSDIRARKQIAYEIVVALDMELQNIVWNSGKVIVDVNHVIYEGPKLEGTTRYYWYVAIWNELGKKYRSELVWFETGLMGTDSTLWQGAQWIGNPKPTINTAALNSYSFFTTYQVESGNQAGIVFSARNKDNYILCEVDMDKRLVTFYEYCDNAWNGSRMEGNVKTKTILGNPCGYQIPLEAVRSGEEFKEHEIEIVASKRVVSLHINKTAIIKEEEILPMNAAFKPRKTDLMSIGFKQRNSKAIYDNICIRNLETKEIYYEKTKDGKFGILSILGSKENGKLVVWNTFELMCPVPSVNVGKVFSIEKEVKSARLYASARGFYQAYLNGQKIGDDYYNPGFTDYRLRIQYQTYDVTDLLSSGANVLGTTVAKGYYTGYCGYVGPMVYGTATSFIGQLVIQYVDGTKEILITDETWSYTDMGPYIDSDYLDGETYDARLFIDWSTLANEDSHWIPCGIKPWPTTVTPTNGSLKEEVQFRLSAQMGPTAKVEREIVKATMVENPKGHYVYDFGQNLVGTIRLKVKGKRGDSIKIRYGEMSYKNGEIYIMNVRSAANTDIYTLKGDVEGEEYIPTFTSHGFRYVEITGNGYELNSSSLVVDITALVITNVHDLTGEFQCSNDLVNKLQQNIQWGQRGNSLLVWTDCPQRNERFGWTGDAQVFMKTAAFNMDVMAFTRKWLLDVMDGQLLYNRDGAVPDTAPLGGDNRPAGCGGWGDAAVIVPWRLYEAYGNKRVLEESYDMMKKWVDYQGLEGRRNYGVRMVDKKEVAEQSDFASIPFIQVQQSRGDHLTFDESTPFILSATAYAAYSAKLLSHTAKLLGNYEDEEKYSRRYKDIKQAFQEAWIKEDGTIAYWGEMSKSGKDKNGNIINQTYYSNDGINHPSQTAYALAIMFDLIPKDKLERAKECFYQTILDQEGHLSVGFLGIEHLAPALSKLGLWDTAYKLLLQEGNPGWLYSVINGATTIWERWNSYIAESGTFGEVSMNSFNHYAYGAIGAWMYENILGISTSRTLGETGYKKVILRPTLGGGLTYAFGYHDSPYGRIESSWKVKGDKFIYNCLIPPSTTAKLYLPTSKIDSILEGGVKATEVEGITYIASKKDRTVCHLESGRYEFLCDL